MCVDVDAAATARSQAATDSADQDFLKTYLATPK